MLKQAAKTDKQQENIGESYIQKNCKKFSTVFRI